MATFGNHITLSVPSAHVLIRVDSEETLGSGPLPLSVPFNLSDAGSGCSAIGTVSLTDTSGELDVTFDGSIAGPVNTCSIGVELSELVLSFDVPSVGEHKTHVGFVGKADKAFRLRFSLDVRVGDPGGGLAGLTLGEGCEAGDYVSLRVSDAGCGMDAADLRRVFDPFYSTKLAGRPLVAPRA